MFIDVGKRTKEKGRRPVIQVCLHLFPLLYLKKSQSKKKRNACVRVSAVESFVFDATGLPYFFSPSLERSREGRRRTATTFSLLLCTCSARVASFVGIFPSQLPPECLRKEEEAGTSFDVACQVSLPFSLSLLLNLLGSGVRKEEEEEDARFNSKKIRTFRSWS